MWFNFAITPRNPTITTREVIADGMDDSGLKREQIGSKNLLWFADSLLKIN